MYLRDLGLVTTLLVQFSGGAVDFSFFQLYSLSVSVIVSYFVVSVSCFHQSFIFQSILSPQLISSILL